MKMERSVFRLMAGLFLMISLLMVFGCDDDSPAEKRRKLAAENSGDIVFAAVGPWSILNKEKDLLPGIDLAVEHVNQKGGVLGRRLRIIPYDDETSIYKAKVIARDLGKQPRFVGVIGNVDCYTALASAPLYEYYGMLMMMPCAPGFRDYPSLPDYKLVFQSSPGVKSEGKLLAETMKSMGIKRVVVYNTQEYEYGKDLADAFEEGAFQIGLTIVDHRSYSIKSNDYYFSKDLTNWKLMYQFDAIFIAGFTHDTARIIKVARSLGLKTKFFCGSGSIGKTMIAPEFQKATEGTIAISYLNLENKDPAVQNFVKDFEKKYARKPDGFAAQGYGTVKSIAEAIKRAKSSVSMDIANELRKMKTLAGPPGPLSYSNSAKILERNLVLKIIKDGQFVPLPPIEAKTDISKTTEASSVKQEKALSSANPSKLEKSE